MTGAGRLVEWGLSLRPDDVPPQVRRAAARHLLDGLGAAIASARSGEAAFVVDVAATLAGPPEATIIGDGRRVSTPAAALANGTLVHALDYDDTHGGALVHATAAVLPPAFAVGEEEGASGAEILTACIVGYETIIRLGAAVPHGFHARGFHATSVCGVFAAALVAARLMALDPERAVHAFGIAGSQASGSLEFLNTGSSTKQLHPGWAGMAGVMAARLAGAGATGPATILEGRWGLFRAYTGVPVDPETVAEGLGDVWETQAITIKPYPACQLSHASLDALHSLREKLGDLDEVEAITFTIPRDSVPIVCEPRANKVEPRTPYEAKFSLPWSAAALAVDGELGIDTFGAGRLRRPEILALAQRIEYEPSDPDSAPADAPGRVEVRFRDGRSLSAEVSRSRGGPETPLSDQEIFGKFLTNCGGDTPVARAVAEGILGLDRVQDIAPILSRTAEVARTGNPK